jgi:hypothetical protein
MSDLVFRRVNGRIIPMKRKTSSGKEKPASFKKPVSNAIAVGTGFGVSAFSGYQAGGMIKDSWKAYGRSARIRGSIKLMKGRVPESVINNSYKDAAKFALAGKSLARRGFGVLSLGIAAGGSLAAIGAWGLGEKKLNDRQNLALNTVVTTATTATALALFQKKAKIPKIAEALKRSGGFKPKDFLNVFSKMGQQKTRETLRSYETLIKTKKMSKSEKGINILNRQMRKRKKKDNPGQMKFDI